jgi:nucleoside-diphosphate-sugar epimerase
VPYAALHGLAYLAERAVALTGATRQPAVTRLGVKLFGADNRVSSEKARGELGWAPRVSIREGIARAARWYLGASAGPVALPAAPADAGHAAGAAGGRP